MFQSMISDVINVMASWQHSRH